MEKVSSTLQQRTYEYLRSEIINLRLKPGEFITDVQIAERLQISRTPVRESFQRLEQEGLLVNEARRGWRVYMLNLKDIYDIFDLKIAIEGMVVRKAAMSRDRYLHESLAESLKRMKLSTESDNPDIWLQEDRDLHNILFLMAENHRAKQFVDNLNDQWHRLRLGYVALQGRTKASVIEHEAFITYILAGQAEEAVELLHDHLSRVRDDLIQLVEKFVMPFSENGF